MSLPEQIIGRIQTLLDRRSGLDLPDWIVAARIAERIEALGISHADRYCDLVSTAAGRRELELLIETLRVGETSFFRHKAQMNAIATVVAPALARNKKKVRVWSAGCASGEEPYTIAMLLRHRLPASVALTVLASDISSDALEVAKKRIYPESAIEQVPSVLRALAFEPAGNGKVRVTPAIADLVTFERRNLAEGNFPAGFDLILCRNVLIYFSSKARDTAIDRLISSLTNDGYLVVGYAESLRSFSRVQAEQTPDAVIYRRGRVPPRELERRSTPRPIQPPVSIATAAVTPTATAAPPPQPATRANTSTAVVELEGRYDDDPERLSLELSRALSGSFGQVVIAVDGAEYLCDKASVLLRRAVNAAIASGVEVRFDAERPGAQRWLRRLGFAAEGNP